MYSSRLAVFILVSLVLAAASPSDEYELFERDLEAHYAETSGLIGRHAFSEQLPLEDRAYDSDFEEAQLLARGWEGDTLYDVGIRIFLSKSRLERKPR